MWKVALFLVSMNRLIWQLSQILNIIQIIVRQLRMLKAIPDNLTNALSSFLSYMATNNCSEVERFHELCFES